MTALTASTALTLTAPAIGTDRPDPFPNGVALWLPHVHTGYEVSCTSRLEFTLSRILGLGGESEGAPRKDGHVAHLPP